MLFTWDTENLCIVFPSWRVTSTLSLLLSLVAVIALTAGYEFVRDVSRRYEARGPGENGVVAPDDLGESSSLLSAGRNGRGNQRDGKSVKAALYAVQVFYSFFIMLLFMTYNGWIMLSVAIGAFVGYMIWGNSPATKSAACH
ncbi:MAG: hypothetical protein M1833_002483 [Piccolia ochrophora]|nr:MAG: hypothetical protein M1833_002483 [Piccolia ochrophora]